MHSMLVIKLSLLILESNRLSVSTCDVMVVWFADQVLR